MDPHIAVDAPRIHIQDGTIEMETGFDIHKDLLPDSNIWNSKSLFFGGTNVLFKNNKMLEAIADQRRFGAVINNYR
jgi:gamma-glutamyltranspeptidase